ncbi:MAG: hypothetical protein K8J09_05020 [Planctomycetes bacterium]|nr:hypothetical protein [Planctomycetota bacterium]MCC7397151.1 hypothetical protein [Planctomycetota bacterium]
MSSTSVSLRAPLRLPERGGSSRLQFGSNDLVLEQVRGGFTLLWSDGREARRYAFGFGTDGELTLELRAPELPLWVTPRELLAIVPGARWSGYVQVPLVPTLIWRRGGGPPQSVVVVHARDLATEWDEAQGYRCLAPSALYVRFPMRSGEPRAVVPLRITNRSQEVLSPAAIPLRLADADLHELREAIVCSPRRLSWNGSNFVVMEAPTLATSRT